MPHHAAPQQDANMQIIVNGNPTEVPDSTDMADLIDRLELTGERLAVEVNEELVPRSRFGEHRLKPDDRVEIIHAVGGG
jgi:sulfur carrier protein